MRPKNLKGDVTLAAFGMVRHTKDTLGPVVVNRRTKFQVYNFIRCKDRKGDQKFAKWLVWSSYELSKIAGNGIVRHITCDFRNNYAHILYCF